MSNDRFRFRVWSVDDAEYESDNYYFMSANGTLRYDDGHGIPMSVSLKISIVEQCTGIKDRNGELIYEGDLLKDGDDIFKCYWIPQKACFSFRNVNDRYEYIDREFYRRQWEIIGNIH